MASLGLLSPRSGLYPGLGFDLSAGLRAGLAHLGLPTDLLTENIGFAEKEATIYAACEKLLQQGVPVVAAYINPMSAAALQPLFESAGGLLLVLDSGYHYPTHEGRLANVVFLSLDGALCCRMAAALAVTESNAPIGFVGSHYDAGYRSLYAMTRPLEEAGTYMRFHHITPLRKAEFTLAPLQQWLEQQEQAPALLAAFCGDMGVDFAGGLRHFENRPAALYGSPYMAESTWLAQTEYPGTDVTACVPWDASLPLEANRQFIEELDGRTPTIFSMLGYEAALLAGFVLESKLRGKAAATALTGQTFDSPRGTLRIDPETYQSQAPVYKATIVEDAATGRCQLAGPPEPMPNTAEQWRLHQGDVASLRDQPVTSWLNAYPCIE